MPITSELDNTRRLKAVGFSDVQAETLVEVIEQAQQRGFERFAEVLERSVIEIRHEISELRSDMSTRFAEQRAEFHSALRDQLLKMVTVFISVVGLAVAVFKLFPNWPH